MSKEVDWKEAPVWAMYHAIDEDGEAFWYKGEPYADSGVWVVDGEYMLYYTFHKYFIYEEDWRNSLQKRP